MYQQYYVYIMTNFKQTVLYVGVTNNIVRRAQEHKNGNNKGCFTYKYNCHTLVYYAIFSKIRDAIAEEKRLKAGNRQQKMNLINSMNPEWIDLAVGFTDSQ